ncbi:MULTISPECIES: helix-turn-helix domain-containing protein [Citrobacter]|uniref:helix-turn-helix domain-containing protein n=1 Tax=Citrobacter TaxID=544 RepID=UPI0023B342BF|nr:MULTISPECIES: helix-turn-helix domain-containing protein [Citrobacter]MDE9582387.1 helix-turn-helix domain-containing protein [Citrobacter braakii]MDM3395951.1 helix-turn-helix domain-containing protein [Citrobacter sp. Cb014]
MEHKSQDWHRADIESALEKRITLRDLSRAAGLSPDSLRNVFTRSWPRAEQFIAQALETSPDVIWPSRYPRQQPEDKTSNTEY